MPWSDQCSEDCQDGSLIGSWLAVGLLNGLCSLKDDQPTLLFLLIELLPACKNISGGKTGYFILQTGNEYKLTKKVSPFIHWQHKPACNKIHIGRHFQYLGK